MEEQELIEVADIPSSTPLVGVIIAGAIGLGVGVVAGYFIGKNRASITIVPAEEPSEDGEKEDTNQLKFFSDVAESEDVEVVEEKAKVIRTLSDLTESLNTSFDYSKINQETSETVGIEGPANQVQDAVVVNIFDHDPNWNMEAELQTRYANAPYVIHIDEYLAEEMGFKQDTLTYYTLDNVMVDSMENPVYDHAGKIGELKFGHGSRDKDSVYVRNEAMRMEWEVLRYEGSYEQEHQGLQMEEEAEESELRHSAVPKFRHE